MTAPRTTRSDEAGFATLLAVIVVILVGTIVGTLMAVNTAERKETARTLVRSEQIAIADTAVSRFLVALNTNTTNRSDNFQLTANAFSRAGSPLRDYITMGELRVYTYTPGSSTLTPHALNQPGRECTTTGLRVQSPPVKRREGATGATWPVDDAAVGTTRFVVEEDHAGRPCAYWEVFRVDPNPLAVETLPLSSFRHVGVVFRVWNGADVTPRYVQTTLSRGSFSDYQLLTDEEIRFGSGVSLSGKVHSNNYTEQPNAIENLGSVTCSGPEVRVTSRTGAIPGAPPSCNARTGASAIDLGALSLAVSEVDQACARDTARQRFRCYGSLGGAGYRVSIGSAIQVSNATTGAVLDTFSQAGRPYTLRFYEDAVYVRDGAGTPSASIAVFAHSDDVSTLHVEGTSFGPPAGAGPVIGLLAQGDIVIDAVQNGAANAWRCDGGANVRINAAMMSETGTLTVPHRWLSQLRQRQTPRCGTLYVEGAIATRTMPVLQMRWGSNVDYGFTGRSLAWNTRLKRVVPPMFPATGPWEVGTWREANHDCLEVDIPAAGSECAL